MTKDAVQSRRVIQGLPIQQVSESLNIPAPTLRSWERRYGIPVTTRTPGGHRRYDEDEINQLRLMRDEVARGKRAADAALSVRLLLDQHNPALPAINRLLDASEARSADAVRESLEESRLERGLAKTLDDVLMPAMRQIGAWWEIGRCDIGQERVMSETVRAWLARLISFSSVDPRDPPILLACGPQDMHTIGLESLAALLAEQGRGSRILGAHTSELTLVDAAESMQVAAVVIVSQLNSHRRSAEGSIRAVDGTGIPVFYAGNAFAFPGRRTGLPGTYLGESMSSARTILGDSVAAGSPRPRAPHRAA